MTNTARTLDNQHYLVIGLGDTGLSCARFLLMQSAKVTVMDTRDAPPMLSHLIETMPNVTVSLGGLDATLLQQADVIVLSPGIDPRAAEIVAARETGKEIIGDIELFARYANAPIVAITGSNGKSTVTTLLAEMAEAAGKQVQVGGNLGTPALDLLITPAPDFYILELSSFQLETVTSLKTCVATVLNISPDHLDRYDGEADYHAAKAQIYQGAVTQVINHADATAAAMARTPQPQIGFSLNAPEAAAFGIAKHKGEAWLAYGNENLLPVDALPLAGDHNTENILAALALGTAMDLPMTAMLTAAQAYRGLLHRCRLVIEHAGVRWFNDSKATNVGATLAAITGLAASGPIVLIAGGVAKDQDFSALTSILSNNVKAVVLLGIDAPLLAAIIPTNVSQQYVVNMRAAVQTAKQVASEGDIILLSPACASFDMFTGYAARGDAFEDAIQQELAA